MILNARQRRVFEETLAATTNALPTLEYLTRLAEVHPGIRDRVGELHTKHEFLRTLATHALEADRVLTPSDS